MEFRRITNLPPYVFTIINNLKIEARRAGRDVIDLGFGNPDIPSPDVAVRKLAEAAEKPANHRYSMSRGLPKLREAIAGYYQRTWDVTLDPELEITNTIGSKMFQHLMGALDRGTRRACRPERSDPNNGRCSRAPICVRPMRLSPTPACRTRRTSSPTRGRVGHRLQKTRVW